MTPPADDEIQQLSRLGKQLIDYILSNESTDTILNLIDAGAPLWYQDDAEGISSLHAAAYQQDAGLVKLLLDKVDNLGNTAGDIALSFNDQETYMVIRDAGIRTELLLSLLSSKTTIANPYSLILREQNSTAAASTNAFLSSNLRFMKDADQDICMLNLGENEVGVMMGWERGIMEDTVARLCDDHPNKGNLKILNVGFGLGIIDSLFQSLSPPPSQHVIIEAHPDVLKHMQATGWNEKPGVRVLEGKWQDWVDRDEILGMGGFDVVYTDTFSEQYTDLREFFDHLPDLLSGPESRMSFFNGLGATNALFYDVYKHIAEIHLANVGVDVEWFDVDVNSDGHINRWGKTQCYFDVPLYHLPIGRMCIGQVQAPSCR